MKIILIILAGTLISIAANPHTVTINSHLSLELKKEIVLEVKYTTVILDTLTYYNPDPKQTDSTPLLTAPLYHIDTIKLKRQQIKWMAVSQIMIKRKIVAYGDTVELISADPLVSGKWLIADCMNKRFDKKGFRGDLLLHVNTKSRGRWLNVKMIIKSYDKSG